MEYDRQDGKRCPYKETHTGSPLTLTTIRSTLFTETKIRSILSSHTGRDKVL